MLNSVIESFCRSECKLADKSEEDCIEKKDERIFKAPMLSMGITSQLSYLLQTKNEEKVSNSAGKWINSVKNKNSDVEPYSRLSQFRKYFPVKDKNLPKELQKLFTPLKCNLCNCSMGSTVTAKAHYDGKKHNLNIRKWLSEHPEYNDGFSVPDANQQKIIDPHMLYCEFCGIMMSSEQQAQSHFEGKKHQSIINGGLMRNDYFNSKTGNWEMSSASDSNVAFGMNSLNKEKKCDKDSKQSFFCEECQVNCPSQITLNDHLLGAKHKKNLILSLDAEPSPVVKDNILEDVMKNDKRISSPSDLSIYRTPSGKYYCHSCNVTVNSPIQFLQHTESKKHKHKSNSSSNKFCK